MKKILQSIVFKRLSWTVLFLYLCFGKPFSLTIYRFETPKTLRRVIQFDSLHKCYDGW